MEVFIIKNTAKGTITNLALDRIERISETTDLTSLETDIATNTSNIANKWSKQGDSGTNPATDFIGTTDGQPLLFKVDGTEVIRTDTLGTLFTTILGCLYIKFSGSAGTQIIFQNSSGVSNAAIQNVGGANELLIYNVLNASGSHEFQINYNTVLQINPNGNVGIGTTAPTQKLDVNGIGRLRSALTLDVNGVSSINNSLRNTGTNLIYKDNVGVENTIIDTTFADTAWAVLVNPGTPGVYTGTIEYRIKDGRLKFKTTAGFSVTAAPAGQVLLGELPVGFRPVYDQVIPVAQVSGSVGNEGCIIVINTSGNLSMYGALASNSYVLGSSIDLTD